MLLESTRCAIFIARKYLFRDIRTLFLIIILLGFAYTNMTFFPALMRGMSMTFQQEFIDTETGHITVEPFDERDRYFYNANELRRKINALPEVIGATIHLELPATAASEYNQLPIPIVAIKPSDETDALRIQKYLRSGEFLEDNDEGKIMLGKQLAGMGRVVVPLERLMRSKAVTKGLNVREGEFINVTFANGATKKFQIKGILSTDGHGPVDTTGYITLKDANEIGIKDTASKIIVRLAKQELENADQMKATLAAAGVEGKIKDWQEAVAFAQAVEITFSVIEYIVFGFGVVIAIAAVGVVLYIQVTRKIREISVMKALGFSNTLIFTSFLAQAIFFGILGWLTGLGISALLNEYFKAFPIQVPVGPVSIIYTARIISRASGLLLAATTLGGMLPARLATHEDILKHIRT